MNGYLTLSEAAARIPGQPHSSCVWRWCRRGILARNGERMRLQHARIGRKILVREVDLEGFFKHLAEADSEYFDTSQAPPKLEPAKVKGERTPGERAAAAQAARARVCHGRSVSMVHGKS